jgi:hypothetical protein
MSCTGLNKNVVNRAQSLGIRKLSISRSAPQILVFFSLLLEKSYMCLNVAARSKSTLGVSKCFLERES